jgi:condensin complex subunit 3
MAMNSFQLFLSQIKSAPESLRIKVLQIVFDIMMSYDKELLGEKEDIVSFFLLISTSILLSLRFFEFLPRHPAVLT